MSEQRSKTNFMFKPQGAEKDLSFFARARFAMLGANGLTEITPESHSELYAVLGAVSEKSGMQTPKAYIWHSKKTVANAVAMPFDKPTIAFSEKITELLNPQELAAVAGHELGHVKNMGHSGKVFWLSAFGGMAIGDLIGRPIQKQLRNQMAAGNPNPLLGVANTAVMAGRLLAPVAAGAVATRSEEYAADRHGAYTMNGDAVPLLSGLQKLSEYHEENFRPTVMGRILSPLSGLLSSHPEFQQRRSALGVTQQEIADYRASHGNELPIEPEQATEKPQEKSHVQAVQNGRAPQQTEKNGNWQSRVGEAGEREGPSAAR